MQIINSIDAFLTWYDKAQSLSDPEKINSFKSIVWSKDPVFYDFRSKTFTDGKFNFDDQILNVFQNFSSFQNKFLADYQNLFPNLTKGLQTFQKSFPKFNIDVPIHLCHSIGECDGATRFIGGENTLVLGLDMIAQLHQLDNYLGFFHHELFHVYHLKLWPHDTKFPDREDTVVHGLWFEGLATYISYALNPNATYHDLLLDIPKNLVPDTEKNLPIVAKAILDNLYATDRKTYGHFFFLNDKSDFPNRCGYYIGMLAIKELAKKYPLEQLIRLQEEKFTSELEIQLKVFSKNGT